MLESSVFLQYFLESGTEWKLYETTKSSNKILVVGRVEEESDVAYSLR